jgi:hypothetical protein
MTTKEKINEMSESLKRKFKAVLCPPKRKRIKKRSSGIYLSKTWNRREQFTNLESGLQNTIVSQNQLIDEQTDEFYSFINTSNQKHEYQTKMFHNLEFLNFGLIFVYTIIFILVKVLILEQYYKQIVVRDEWTDTIILTLFFLYPFLIYSVEMYLYDFVMMIVAYFYGMSRIPEFDDILTGTDFYKNPSPNPNDPRDTRSKFQ